MSTITHVINAKFINSITQKVADCKFCFVMNL